MREFLRQSRWSLSVLPSDNLAGFQFSAQGMDVLQLQFAASGGIEIAIDTACLAKRYMNIDACHGMLMDIYCKNSLLAGEYIGFRDI